MPNKVGDEGAEMSKPNPRNQFIAAAVVSGIATQSIGTVLGFSAILLPQLAQERELSESDKSWIASLSNIGQLFGALLTGILSSKFGRRITIMILCLPLLGGWVVIWLSQGDVLLICLGRVLQGVGVMSSVTQVYLVEIADPERRGLFGASGAMAVSAGITATYGLGALLPWRIVCLVCGAIPIVVFVLMIFLPETPPWLVLNQKEEAAEKSLRWLRGESYDINQEIEALKKAQGDSSQGGGLCQTLATFKYPGAHKPFIILLIVFTLQQMTGTYAVIFYAVTLFKNMEQGGSRNPYFPAILTGCIRILGSLLGTVLLKKFGRKPLMIVSALGMAFFMSTLALTIHYKDKLHADFCGSQSFSEVDDEAVTEATTEAVTETVYQFAPNQTENGCLLADQIPFGKQFEMVFAIYPPVAVMLYMLVFGIGVGTVPWLLLGELCPSKVKGVASGITVFTAFLVIFLVVKTFPHLLELVGAPGTFLLYATVCVLTALYTWISVPETRGKSLPEIQTLFGEIQ